MANWTAPQRPTEYAEQAMINAILDDTYPPGSTLPGERDLSTQLGVTRPTLRTALQRMERDGWITIHQGKATEVRNFWNEGGLNILSALIRSGHKVPFELVPKLLEVRLTLAPAYTYAAVTNIESDELEVWLNRYKNLDATAEAYASFDWELHHRLTIASSNPIYTLILNGFKDFYADMALLYFSHPQARASSQRFYATLSDAIHHGNAEQAKSITREVMAESIALWNLTLKQQGIER